MLFIKEIKPTLNTQPDTVHATEALCVTFFPLGLTFMRASQLLLFQRCIISLSSQEPKQTVNDSLILEFNE